jgi:hypothetical protein
MVLELRYSSRLKRLVQNSLGNVDEDIIDMSRHRLFCRSINH